MTGVRQRKLRTCEDLSGRRFGRLVVQRRVDAPPGKSHWLCLCDCGGTKIVRQAHLVHGPTKSCGCLHDTFRLEHGHCRGRRGTPTHKSWDAMIGRCTRPTNASYKNYGGRGITVCERWRSSFKNFLEDMGERPTGKTIDRIDSDGDYEPGNCRWATAAEQLANRKPRKLKLVA